MSSRLQGGAADRSDDNDPLAVAYESRTMQLYEARGALAELVSTLEAELLRQRAEVEEARRHAEALQAEVARLNATIATLQNTKVMRWTRSARGFVYRRRARRG